MKAHSLTKEQLEQISRTMGNFHADYLATAGELFLNEARRQVSEYEKSKWMRPEPWCYELLRRVV